MSGNNTIELSLENNSITRRNRSTTELPTYERIFHSALILIELEEFFNLNEIRVHDKFRIAWSHLTGG